MLLVQVSRSILIGARSYSTQEGSDEYIVNDEITHHYSIEFETTMSLYSECIDRTSRGMRAKDENIPRELFKRRHRFHYEQILVAVALFRSLLDHQSLCVSLRRTSSDSKHRCRELDPLIVRAALVKVSPSTLSHGSIRVRPSDCKSHTRMH